MKNGNDSPVKGVDFGVRPGWPKVNASPSAATGRRRTRAASEPSEGYLGGVLVGIEGVFAIVPEPGVMLDTMNRDFARPSCAAAYSQHG